MDLYFIYNANSGLISYSFGALHKIMSPKTYQCNLCKITHGAFTEKKEWTDFVKKSKHNFKFMYSDEFEKQFQQKFSYPCVLYKNEVNLELVLDRNNIEKFNNLEDFINEIKNITT